MYGGYPYGAPPPPPRGGAGGNGYGGMRPTGLPRGVPMPYGVPGIPAFENAPQPMMYAPEPMTFDGRMPVDAIEEEIRMRQERIRQLDMKVKEREIMDLERKEQELRQKAADRRGGQRQTQVRDRSRSPRGPVGAAGQQQLRPRHVNAKAMAPRASPRTSPTPESYFKPARPGVVPSGKAPVAPRAAAAEQWEDPVEAAQAEYYSRRTRGAERGAAAHQWEEPVEEAQADYYSRPPRGGARGAAARQWEDPVGAAQADYYSRPPRGGARGAAAHQWEDPVEEAQADYYSRPPRGGARTAAWRTGQQTEASARPITLTSAPGRGGAPASRPASNLVLAPRATGDRQPVAPAGPGRAPVHSKLLLEPAPHARAEPAVVRSKAPVAADAYGYPKGGASCRGVYFNKNELTIDYAGSDLSTIEKATEVHDSMVQIFESMGMVPEGETETSAALVELSRCQLGDEALEMFLQTLVSFKVRPRVLKLFRNQIGNAGMDALSEFVLHTPTAVEEFHLSHNKISEDGVTDVLGTMQKHEAYTALERPAWFRVEHNEIKDPRELLRFLREDLGVEYRLSEKPSWKKDEKDTTLVTLFPL